METFICLLFDDDGAIIASTSIAARAPAEAEVVGGALLQQTREAVVLELWRQGDKIWTVHRGVDQNAAS